MSRVHHHRIARLSALLLSGAGTLAHAQTQDIPTTTAAGGTPTQAAAAPEAAGMTDQSGEIVVTARKRVETAFDAPVVLQAVGAPELERRAINNVEGLARVTPLLVIGANSGGVQGSPIAIRGISGSEINPFADQAVSFNIDGIQVARSAIARLATMDLASAEILKGPQALFFGKNSPAGIISINTADPTTRFDWRLSGGYEFDADEKRLEGFVSTPLTDTLGVRVAGYYSSMKGYVQNDAVQTGNLLKAYDRAPKGHEFAGRFTAKWEPDDRFSARLKVNYNDANDTGHSSYNQIISCGVPGVPQFSSVRAGCSADGHFSQLDPGPALESVYHTPKNGRQFSDRVQTLSSLEMNFKPVEDVTITSMSGYYSFHSNSLINVSALDTAPNYFATIENYDVGEFSQEFRALSSFAGFFNFSGGALYQSSKLHYHNTSALSSATGVFRPLFFDANNTQRGDSYSFFGQAILKPIDSVEISGGGRYSHESKRLRTVVRGVDQISLDPEVAFSNFSPEVTVKWSATDDLNLFGSYRTGFLSGGFNGGVANNYTGVDLTYGQQKTNGFEAGAKVRLFDRAVRLNLALFDYRITGLQVGTTQGNQVFISNAGKAYTRGVEIDGTWTTPVQGLSLRGALSYDKARYKRFTFNCYRGQSVAQGCNLLPVNGVFTQQNLAGGRIVRAPQWGGAVGANYETTVGNFKLGVSGDGNYSGGYFNNTLDAPQLFQKSYWLVDANVRVGTANDGWELALIGRNLTNRYYVARASEQPFSGGASGLAAAGRPADAIGAVNRGREIMLRLTLRPGAF